MNKDEKYLQLRELNREFLTLVALGRLEEAEVMLALINQIELEEETE